MGLTNESKQREVIQELERQIKIIITVIIKCIVLRNVCVEERLHDEYDQSHSLAELLWTELKSFSYPIWKKHSAYYTAQFPILSQVHTNTLTSRMRNEAAAQNNLPDRLRDTKTHRQKGKAVIM